MELDKEFLKQVFLDHNLSVYEEKKYSFFKNIINLKKLDIIKKERLKEELKTLFEPIDNLPNGNKSVYIFSAKIDEIKSIFLVKNGDYFVSIEMHPIDRPHIIFFDNNMDIIYTKYAFYIHQPVYWGIETQYFFYSRKRLNLLINTYKDKPCYVKRSFGNNNFNFVFHGKEKPHRMSVYENTIEVEFQNSMYRNIVFDKSFNLKEVTLSDSYYKKLNEFHSEKKIKCSSYEDFTKKLETAFLLINLQYDKDPYFISKEMFEKQVNYLKKSFENQSILDSDNQCFDLIDNTYQHFNSFYDRLTKYMASDSFQEKYKKDSSTIVNSNNLIQIFFYIFLNKEINENKIDFFNMDIVNGIKQMHLLYEQKML